MKARTDRFGLRTETKTPGDGTVLNPGAVPLLGTVYAGGLVVLENGRQIQIPNLRELNTEGTPFRHIYRVNIPEHLNAPIVAERGGSALMVVRDGHEEEDEAGAWVIIHALGDPATAPKPYKALPAEGRNPAGAIYAPQNIVHELTPEEEAEDESLRNGSQQVRREWAEAAFGGDKDRLEGVVAAMHLLLTPDQEETTKP